MSYFFGTPLTSVDQGSCKSDRKKHRRKTVTNEYELEPVHGARHRRKHSSRSRFSSRSRATSVTDENNDQGISSPKTKYKRHKEIGQLISDKLMAKLQSTPESGFVEELSDKEGQLTKYRTKYSKLQKAFQTIQVENSNLQEALEKREKDYKDLYSHYEELTKHVQTLEKEKSHVIAGCRKLKAENIQLEEDVSLLKILIYKLNVELERYQDKLRCSQSPDDSKNSKVEDGDPATESRKIVESWGKVDTHVLAPLLDAYQENLEENAELIKHFKQEIDHFSGRCKEIVAENESLRKDIEEHKLEKEKFAAEMKAMEEDASVIKEENDILMRQASLQKQKLHEIHSIYEKKVESMSQDNNQLHANYLACKTELSNLQGKYEILNDGFEKLKKNLEKTMPVSVHTEAIEECKRLFEELKSQYETEKKKLMGQLRRFEQTNPENEKLLAALTAERDHLKYLTKNLEKNLKRTQYKLESLQSNVCSIQVSRDSFKRQLAKTTAYCEELVTQQEKLLAERKELLSLLQEKEKENKNIQSLGDNIAQRMGTLKSQLKSVQKGAREQLETVEKNIKIQEVGVGKMKSDYHRELHRLRQLIKQKEDVIGKLQREKYATQDNLELVWKAATSDDRRVGDINAATSGNEGLSH